MSDLMDRVVLLEFPDEAEAFITQYRHQGLDPASAKVICLDAKAQVWLRQQGVESVNSLPYFDSASHARALRKSHELLYWLEPRLNVEDRLGIKGAYTNALMWYSRFIIHHLLYLSEILSSIQTQHPGITLQTASGHPKGHGSPFLQQDERYLGALAEAFCKLKDIEFETILTKRPQPFVLKGGTRVRWLKWLITGVGGRLQRSALRRMRGERPLLSLTRGFRMDTIVRQAREGAPELPWVVMGEGARALGGVDALRRALGAVKPRAASSNGNVYMGEAWLRVLEWTTKEDPEFLERLSTGLDKLCQEIEDADELFSHAGVPFGSQLASKIRSGIGSAIRIVHREVCAYDEVLSLLSPRLVITPFGRRSQHALGELTQRRGIPSLLISHGSFTPIKDDLEGMGWNFHAYGLFHGTYTHAAIQTPLAESYANGLNASAKFVRTGPLSWGATVSRENSQVLKAKLLPGQQDSRVVVHAGTPKARSYMHFHVYETMDEYIAALKDLITAIEQVPDAFLIIKFRPFYLSEDELRALLPASDRFCISVDESFLDVLGITDLLVSFSSTTIEEALQNRVPVLLYGGEGRYQHIEAPEVSPGIEVEPGAVYAIRRAEHLADGIKNILDINGPAPLLEDLFQPYAYSPEDYNPFPELVRDLVKA